MKPGHNDLTVMTMNLRFGLADDGENSWKNRKDLCAKTLKRNPSSFLGVQESNHFQTRFLSQKLENHELIGWYNLSKDWWQSNLIFYDNDWECLKDKHYFLSDTPGTESTMPGSKWPRQCVIGLFRNTDRKIILANTHFDFSESVQEQSAALIIDFLSDFPKDCPVIITGDFNANPGSNAHAVFMDNGFIDIFDHHQYATTFHDFTGKDTRQHIDWILYRGNITPGRKKIITDTFSGRYPSDHYPVMANFYF